MRRHVIISVIVMSLLMTAAIASAKERVFYYHNDHLGTPQVMTDEAGVTVWEAEYLPFGEAAVNEDPDGDGVLVVSNIRFPGQYYDSETGLHYNWHRDYQPRTGRYLEADPIGIDQGRNHLYVYVQNDPVNLIDPLGLISCKGKWYKYKWEKVTSLFLGGCKCYWLCIPCSGEFIWGGDYHTLPMTKGGIAEDKYGRFCACGKPGQETGCEGEPCGIWRDY